ncbi:ABC transporter ATP-binding protein [Scatolibacter rhodanostii]|uniref:ABC transporter ATP-binding protein n=1 Tax=Scatolibacter rhodanostii TaxID=2014781 RepID=UPI000C06CCB8|nr:ATP-binding cassette domain-containing protein [Scatolibacter rhodanostii]
MLIINEISKTFHKGTQNERNAISSLSLKASDGEFITIIGGNGAGKSTLLNLIAGTHFPDSGQILLADEDITYLPEHQRAKNIGHLFQDPLMGTAPNMTLEENLSLAFLRGGHRGLRPGLSKKNISIFEEHLKSLDLGLESRLKTKVGLLSGGQRQAVTLLMATIATPHLLLLDEHTAALDPTTADKVLNLTQKISKEHGITTLMITHNIEHALAYGDRTLMMQHGEIVMDIAGEERANMTVESLLQNFKAQSGQNLTNDRMLLS